MIRFTDLLIPTVGQIVGLEDEWDNKNLEPDSDEQLPFDERVQESNCLFLKISITWDG